MDVITKIFGIFAVVLLFFGVLFIAFNLSDGKTVDPNKNSTSNNVIQDIPSTKKFSSCNELKLYLKENQISGQRGYNEMIDAVPMAAVAEAAADSGSLGASKSTDYSSTNVQVQGVDEADLVKTDGKYVYLISRNDLIIVDGYPAKNAEILSKTDTKIYPSELFINNDKLVVFGSNGRSAWDHYATTIQIYDISDRSKPELQESFSLDGYYVDSRMIGDFVYIVANKPVYYAEDQPIPLPAVRKDLEKTNESSDCGEIYYFNEPDYSYAFTTIVSIDLTDNELFDKVYLTGSSQNIYVSKNNIYLTRTVYDYNQPILEKAVSVATGIDVMPQQNEKTSIHKLSVNELDITHVAEGEVPGHVLNQFSMDEHNDYFRIATTVGHVARSADEASSKNNIYVLDEDLEIVGSVEDLAPGEKIYSARFMGDKAYLVTFRKVDPLFVIDLEDPENPEVLGKLKIPGYSDYLHPYDENYIIGLGKDAIPADEGDFAWYQGVKLSLFDVSDFENPKEVANFNIGDRGTDSYALNDHKAFLFSKSKNLLVIPILLAEIHEEQYPEGLPPYAYGDYTFQGAYVFSITPEDGFELKGRISHMGDDNELLKSGYYFDSDSSVKRSLYIEDVLYTISNQKIKMNALDDLSEINQVTFS